MIKSLYIPYQQDCSPAILFDTFDNLLNYSFSNTNVYTLNLKNFNMILSYLDFSIEDKINKAATVLFRTYSNDFQSSTLYGNCLVFDSSNQDFPVHLVDSIYSIFTNFK
jgi:hypothetical protein